MNIMRPKFTLVLLCLLANSGLAQNRTHDLRLEPQNVYWGYYDARVSPVLRIASGDTVRVETSVVRGVERLRAAGVADEEIPESLKVVDRAVTDRVGAHVLTGPIYVDGAVSGDTLAVEIVEIEFLHPYGVAHDGPEPGP